jgi:N-acetyl-alpha-D-muramate 1-phosphate uridylyltransferase
MQVAILAGGMATRLGGLTKQTPKSMVLVNNLPFLEYQLRLLKENGIQDIVLCTGHLSGQIVDYFGDGRSWGFDIKYSIEDHPLGTAGALKNAVSLLEEVFFIMYGDSYLCFDFRRVYEYFTHHNTLGLMTVYKNLDQYDLSNTAVNGEIVTRYDKENRQGLSYIDYGANIFRKSALNLVPDNAFYSMEELFRQLVVRKELLAYEIKQRFYEIGSPQGLREFSEHMTAVKQGESR